MVTTAQNSGTSADFCRGQGRGMGQRGFSLIELLVALVIGLILVKLAVPEFSNAMEQQHASAEANNLLNDLEYARTEAMKEAQHVTVCASTDGATCSDSNSWQSGWIVFSNPGWTSATAGTPTFTSGTSVLLRSQSAFTTSDTLTETGSGGSVTYNRDGFSTDITSTPSTGTLFTLHTSPTNSSATQCLWIDVLGHTWVQYSGSTKNTNQGQTTSCS